MGAKLGQHLLTSAYIARDVADAAHVVSGDTVLEVGPGKGMLTKELLAMGANVVAVEKDSDMVAHLRAEFGNDIETESWCCTKLMSVTFCVIRHRQKRIR